eukprot:CCRYP_005742-RB/>CCRYP_005742-RB protein AED:0.40 eAED:0.40 QI:0/0/0/1/0/0/2/0/234
MLLEKCAMNLEKVLAIKRMEAKKSSQTKLLFCTTEVVSRHLQDDSNLAGVIHIIVDEVHECQQQTDVLPLILQTLLIATRPDLKIILMSVTLDTKLFCSYFYGTPLISVPGKMFPIKDYFLEDLIEAMRYVIEEGSVYAHLESRCTDQILLWVTTRGGDKCREVQANTSTQRSMEMVDKEVINFDLIEDVLTLLLVVDQSGCTLNANDIDLSNGNILIFLRGIGKIKAMTECLK